MAAVDKAPQRKPELVEALLPLTRLTRAQLNEMKVDQLKVVWNALKPQKKESVLPANWKKGDKPMLQNLYQTMVVDFYKKPQDGHWLSWNRARLIHELEWYQTEVQEMMETPESKIDIPVCPECGIPMCERTNRLDGSLFYGCYRFPCCRATLPITMAGKPTAEMQKIQKAKEFKQYQDWISKQAKSSGYKVVGADDSEEMNGDALRRVRRVKPQSEASSGTDWEMPTPVGNKPEKITLTPEELNLIKEKRLQDKTN